jgi:hypothetical protein
MNPSFTSVAANERLMHASPNITARSVLAVVFIGYLSLLFPEGDAAGLHRLSEV